MEAGEGGGIRQWTGVHMVARRSASTPLQTLALVQRTSGRAAPIGPARGSREHTQMPARLLDVHTAFEGRITSPRADGCCNLLGRLNKKVPI